MRGRAGWWQALWLAVVAAAPAQAHAQERRYALVLGANSGDAADAHLAYAVRDAERVAEVLRDMGGFMPENVVLLADPSADAVRGSLARLNNRIESEQAAGPGAAGPGLLLVYYSGHADANALHLGGSRLSWEELKRMTSSSPAEARILIVDACRSGNATRVKGTKLTAPFALPDAAGGEPEGFAIISSASAGENAQESDAVEGSFFTHHLLSGLTGGADEDGDGMVGMAEAYRYAADRTMASTATTLEGVQHPTYAFDIRGHSDIVLTAPGNARLRGKLEFPARGQYLLRRHGPEGALAAEINVGDDGAPARALWLRPGRYFVQRRTPEQFQEGYVEVPQSGRAHIAVEQLAAADPPATTSKRAGPDRCLAIAGDVAWPGPAGFDPGLGARVGVGVAWSGLRWDLDLGWGQNQHPGAWDSGHYATTAVNIRTRINGFYILGGPRLELLDLGVLVASLGARTGAALLIQTYDDLESLGHIAPVRRRISPVGELVARLELPLPPAFFLEIEGGPRLMYVPWEENGHTRFPLSLQIGAGGGVRW